MLVHERLCMLTQQLSHNGTIGHSSVVLCRRKNSFRLSAQAAAATISLDFGRWQTVKIGGIEVCIEVE